MTLMILRSADQAFYRVPSVEKCLSNDWTGVIVYCLEINHIVIIINKKGIFMHIIEWNFRQDMTVKWWHLSSHICKLVHPNELWFLSISHWEPLFCSISTSSTFLDSTCKWNHAAFVLLCLAYFTSHNILQLHPCRHIIQGFLLVFFLKLRIAQSFTCNNW